MKLLKLSAILFFLLACFTIKAQKRPNIILFLVDDMGWQDTSVPFWDSITAANKKFHTPNMERLAARSMKFTNAYANSICTPSRVSLMSGMNAARHRVTNWTMFKNEAVDPKDSILSIPDWNVNGLSPEKGLERSVYVTALPQLLKNVGYYTIHCGKAHFGAYKTPGADPLNIGFDVNIAGSAAGNPASYMAEDDYGNVQGKFNLRAVPGLKKYWGSHTFLSEALTLEAQLAMDSALEKKQPFFLYMAHFAVHVPYNDDPRYFERYRKMGLDSSEAAYAGLVEGMDASLGRLMQYLKDHQLEKNTIIIFMSDNGGLSNPPRSGKVNSQNYPLRDGKGSLYEGGIREPMLVDWPGVTKPGSETSQYVVIQDFFPTILEMAKVKNYKTVQTIDGESFVPALKNKNYTDSTRTLIWHFPNKWAGASNDKEFSWMSALRKGNWKLIYFQKNGKLELYNLKNDIGEQHNLSSVFPEKVKELAKLLTTKLKNHNAQMPLIEQNGERVKWPDEVK